MSRSCLAAWIFAAGGLFGVATGQGSSTQTPRSSANDDASCADCHAEIVSAYARTPMARALRTLDEFDLDGLPAVREKKGGFRYRLSGRGSGACIVEDWLDREERVRAGTETRVPLRFAIGAGVWDTSFAAELGGQLWFAPLELISASGESPRFPQLTPKHMHRPGQRFSSPIPEECLACHTERLPEYDYPLNAVPDASWTLHGIGCAACHGDGAKHVAWRRAELENRAHEGADPIVAPSRLDVHRRVSVCARCHLQSDARVAFDPGAHGLPPPGEDLLEHLALYVAARTTDDIGFVAQAERMCLSKCFSASLTRAKNLTCETCHDPHRSLFDATERARVRSACARCHLASGATDAAHALACSLEFEKRGSKECVDCHLRQTPVFDVAGPQIHDHWIRRLDPPPSKFDRIRATQADGGPIARFRWPDAPLRFENDPGVEMLALNAASEPREAIALLDRKPDAKIGALPLYHHVRGAMLQGLGRVDEACRAYERALELDPRSTATRINLAAAWVSLGRAKEAVAALDAILAKFPRSELALRNRGIAKLALGDANGARADLEAALSLFPRGDVARSLAGLCRELGDAAASEAWLAKANLLDPRD